MRPYVYRRALIAEPDCSACPLRKTCEKVPPEGNVNADIAFVGLGPGTQECREGRPFIGPAGQLLDKALEEAGLDRAQIWISNGSYGFPWAQTVDGVYWSKPRIEKAAVKACRGRLLRELAIVQPKVIVAVGALTMGVLTDDVQGITKLQGSLNRLTRDAGLDPAPWVIPVFHPAHLLRGEQRHYPQVVAGFRKAARIAKEGPSPPPGKLLLIDPTSSTIENELAMLEAIVDDVVASGVDAAIDIETANASGGFDCLDDTLTVFGFAATTAAGPNAGEPPGPVAASITIRTWTEAGFVVAWTPGQWQRVDACVKKLLASRNKKWLWNYGYDYTVLSRHYDVTEQLKEILSDPDHAVIGDGMIYHHLIQPDSLHGLDFVAQTELDVPPWKWLFRQKEKAGNATHRDLLIYNAQDCLYTLALIPTLRARCEAVGNLHIYRHQMEMAEHARRMHVYGIPVDQDGWRKAYFEHEQKRYAALERVKDAIRTTPDAVADLNEFCRQRRAKRKNPDAPPLEPEVEDPAAPLPGQLNLPKVKGIPKRKPKKWITADQFNPNSADHGCWFLYQFLRLPPTRWTKGGAEKDATKQQPSSSYKGVLEHLRDPLVKAYVDRAEEEGKLRALEIVQRNIRPQTGRLHPSWNSVGQAGTRFSSSPNCQNWDKTTKRITRQPEGRVWVAADAAAVEYRIAAFLAGIPELLTLFNAPPFDENDPNEKWKKYDGRYDAHSLLATDVFGAFYTQADYRAVTRWVCEACGHEHAGMPDRCSRCRAVVEEVLLAWDCPNLECSRKGIPIGSADPFDDGYLVCPSCGKRPPVCKTTDGLRTLVKRVVYALFYGAFPEKILSSLLEDKRLPSGFRALLNLARIEQVHTGFSQRFPQWDRWANEQVVRVRIHGYQEFPPFGRRVYWALPNLVEETKIRNTPIQRAAGDIVNLMFKKMVAEIDARGLDARWVIHAHDAICLDVAETDAAATTEIVNRCFDTWLERVDVFGNHLKIHILGQAKTGPTLADV